MFERLIRLVASAGRRELVLVVGAGLFALCAWIFLELADGAPDGDYLALEERILLAFRDADAPERVRGPAWIVEVAHDVTALGSATVIIVVTVATGVLLLLRRQGRTALLIAVATAGGSLLNALMKGWFERGRPTVVPHLADETSLSFPSGHSMVSAAAYLTLGVLLAQTVATRAEKLYCVAVAVLLTAAIGVSRVVLGVHYPTDVLAGWCAGLAWAVLCWGVAAWLQQRGAIATPAADAGTPPDRAR